MHRRSTSCIPGCQPYPTILRQRAMFCAQAARFVHLVCFYQLRISHAPGYFDAQAQYFVHSGLPLTSNPSPTAGHFSCTGAMLHSVRVFLRIVHLTFAGLFLIHRRSTSCILGCILYALALRFVDIQEHRFEDILALAPEVNEMMSRSFDLKTFWPWLQKSTK